MKVTVDAYVEAMEQGDTDALCAIQTEELAAQACPQAAEGFDWAEVWAAWAVAGGTSFSVDGQRSGEWRIDGFTPPSGGGGERAERHKSADRRRRRWRCEHGASGSAAPSAAPEMVL